MSSVKYAESIYKKSGISICRLLISNSLTRALVMNAILQMVFHGIGQIAVVFSWPQVT